MKKNELDIVFVLDRSGSMQGSESDTIGGYNSYLEKQRGNDTKVTTVLFDNEYQLLHFRKDIKEVDKLDNNIYFVGGSTALYDAIGMTITKLDKAKVKNKVLFVIITDGLENSSCEYNKKNVKKLITKHSDWEFVYLGANIDSYEEGSAIGIRKERIANYKKTRGGFEGVFASVNYMCDCMVSNEEIADSWKDNISE